MQLQFKKCTIKDLDTLLKLSRKTFVDAFEAVNNPEDFWDYINKAFSRETIAAQLNDERSHFYFCLLKNTPVGYFKLNEAGAQTDINDPDSMELERIYVLENHQGKQLGKRFLEAIVAFAREKKTEYIWLGVWEENEDAIRFYERYGFTKFGKHNYVVGTDVQTDWLMRKEL